MYLIAGLDSTNSPAEANHLQLPVVLGTVPKLRVDSLESLIGISVSSASPDTCDHRTDRLIACSASQQLPEIMTARGEQASDQFSVSG